MPHVTYHVVTAPTPYAWFWCHYSQSERHVQLFCSFHHACWVTWGGEAATNMASPLWLQEEGCSFCWAFVFFASIQATKDREEKVGGSHIVWSLWTPQQCFFSESKQSDNITLASVQLGKSHTAQLSPRWLLCSSYVSRQRWSSMLLCFMGSSWCLLCCSRREKSRLILIYWGTYREISPQAWDLQMKLQQISKVCLYLTNESCYQLIFFSCTTSTFLAQYSWIPEQSSHDICGPYLDPVQLSGSDRHAYPHTCSSPLYMWLHVIFIVDVNHIYNI